MSREQQALAEARRLRMALQAIENDPLEAAFQAGMMAMARVASGCSKIIRNGDNEAFYRDLVELSKNVDREAAMAQDPKVLG